MTYKHYLIFLFCLILFNSDENFSSEGEREDASTNVCHSLFKACGKDGSISCGVKRHQGLCSLEQCAEESAGPAYCEWSSSAREEQQRHSFMDSDDKPKLSCVHGNVFVHRCNNAGEKPFSCAVCETTPSCKGNMDFCGETKAGEESHAQDQNMDGKQSTSLSTEAQQQQTKRSAPYHTVCRSSV